MNIFVDFFRGTVPGMKALWLIVPCIAAAIIINIIYLPGFIALIASGISVVGGVVAAGAAARTARSSRDIALERNELKSVVLSLQDALVVYDTNFRIVFINPAAEKLFGFGRDRLVGRVVQPSDAQDPALKRFIHIIYPSLAPTMVPRTPSGEYPQVIDISFTDPLLELQVVTSPIRNEAGNVLGFMKIARDRTREIAILKSKNEFITVASHQLRTPMSEIGWALETLAENQSLNEDAKSIVTTMLSSVRLLVKVTEDLLNIAKIEEGRFGYDFKQTDMAVFLDGILAGISGSIQQAGLKIYFDRPPTPLLPVFIDEKKLSIAVTNLLENAVRYNVRNGEIVVKLEEVPRAPFVKVSVKDTGIGIPPEDVDRLFTKFFRAQNAVRFETQGSGLGLYITRNIIHAHGGRMEIESELNRGSTFSFILPTDQSLVPARETPATF